MSKLNINTAHNQERLEQVRTIINDLSDIIHRAIQEQLNIDAFNFEVERYTADIDRINGIRETIVKFMRRQAADLF